MTVKMSNAPVYYALNAAQFVEVPGMATKYAIEFQDYLRLEGYPLFREEKRNELRFQPAAPNQVAMPQIVESAAWFMTSTDRTSGFILTPSALMFHTTSYETREQFIPVLLKALKKLHEIVKLTHVTGLGLRYLNAVLPRKDEELSQYLAPGLAGVTIPDCQLIYNSSESLMTTKVTPLTEHGKLVFRVFRAGGPLGYPGDLNPNELAFQARFVADMPDLHAVIDLDHSAEGVFPLEFDKLDGQLRSLHSGIETTFNSLVSAHAQSVWR